MTNKQTPAAPATARSQTTSTTAAGQSDNTVHSQRPAPSQPLIDAINQVFALFRINYHNQYHSAFGDVNTVNQAKRLWVESLQRFEPDVILRAAKQAIEQSDYLPTLHKMLTYCQGTPEQHGLPDVHSAYMEACRAPSPKTEYNWSHPAVYHAGRDSDWFFLANNPERLTFPVFKDHYKRICDKVLAGDALPEIEIKRLTETSTTPLSKEENLERLNKLREEMGL